MKTYFLVIFFISKAFRVFKKKTVIVEESIHVIFDESNLPFRKDFLDDDISILQKNIDEISHEKEKDQKEIINDESKDEELNEPQYIEKEPRHPRERLCQRWQDH